MQLTSLSAETLAPIRARFLAALRDRETRVKEAARTARSACPAALYDDIHKIRGVAPMLGLGALGAIAAEAETRFELWADTDARPQPHMPADLHQTLQSLHAAICDALA